MPSSCSPAAALGFICFISCLLAFLIFAIIGSTSMSEYDQYSHKRTGRLVHCYGTTVTIHSRSGNSVYYCVNEIYSCHSHGDTSLDDTHNCTMRGSKSYNNLEDAQSAAQSVQLGEFRTVFVANNHGHSCIGAETRNYDHLLALAMLISLPGLCLLPCCCAACWFGYRKVIDEYGYYYCSGISITNNRRRTLPGAHVVYSKPLRREDTQWAHARLASAAATPTLYYATVTVTPVPIAAATFIPSGSVGSGNVENDRFGSGNWTTRSSSAPFS